MVLVVGFPRSGTNLLHRILAHYLDGPGPPWNGIGKHERVAKIHWPYQRINYEESLLVDIVRDPRDTAVSGYFYYMRFLAHHYGHSRENWSFSDFLRNQFANGFDGYRGWPTGWKGNTREWLMTLVAARVFYEELRDNRAQALRKVLKGLGEEIDEGRIEYAVGTSYQFSAQRASYVTGEPVDAGASEWRAFFDQEAIQFLKDYAGYLMVKFGYE